MKNFNESKKEIENEGYEIEVIMPYQFRINRCLDIYPKNRKFCDVERQKWGVIDEEYTMFIIKFFNRKYAKIRPWAKMK